MNNIDVSVSNEEIKKIERIGKGLLISIAYASTCGGMACLPGTGPNLIFYAMIEERYGSKMNLNFISFMMFGLPISAICLIIIYIILCLKFIGYNDLFKKENNIVKDINIMEHLRKEYTELGKISRTEISVMVIFSMLIFMWVFREPGFPCLGILFEYENDGVKMKYWKDGASALMAALLLFAIPREIYLEKPTGKVENLLEWNHIQRTLPWGLLFIFGSGFALAAGCEKSGLSSNLGNSLTYFMDFPPLVILLIISLSVSLLTELTSNSATATIFLPIIFRMAESIKIHPMILGLSTTLACSFSFCLPAATPPNAIIFATGKVKVTDMISVGLFVNILCVLVLSLMTYYYSNLIFQTDKYPDWINANFSKL